jgi:hypothetical protein
VTSTYNQEPLNQVPSILENFTQILPNSVEFQTLELPRILIQILARILESSNQENCSLLQNLQSRILFAIFGVPEVHLLIDSIQVFLK